MFISRTSRVFLVLLALAVALSTVSFIVRSPVVSSADHSYDSIEQVRALRSDASIHSISSYDQVERIRLLRGLSLTAWDTSYDIVERVRTERGLIADRSYDSIEGIRLLR